MKLLSHNEGARVSALGLDIGTHATKAVLLSSFGNRIDIHDASAVEMAQGTVANGVVINRKAFAKVFRSRLRDSEFPNPRVSFSVPSSLATLRWASLPRLAPAELREAAKFKIRKHLPFPIDQAYIEVTQQDNGETEGGIPSMVICIRREVVDSRAEAISACGLTPIRAELEAQAILRIVERRLSGRSVLWRDASLTIIDVGGENTHMYVVQNQRLQFIRGVKFGGEAFTTAVSEALSISPEVAREALGDPRSELCADGVIRLELPEGQAQVSLSRELEKLTREFLRLLRYFRSLHPERSYAGILDHLVVCGGLVGLSGFAEYLQGTLGLRVERARPIAGMMGLFDRDTFLSVASRQEAFSVATGLALAGLEKYVEGGAKNVNREFSWKRSA